MKAEHRKELETNVLADRMGRMVQRVRANPRRRTMFYVVGAVAIVALLYIAVRHIQGNKAENSKLWVELDDGASPYVGELYRRKETPQGKVMRFENAWRWLWHAVQKLGQGPIVQIDEVDPETNKRIPKMRLISEELNEIETMYETLARDCAKDPYWEPEALYHLAVIEETRAIFKKDEQDILDQLRSAEKRYADLATKYGDSGYGKMAKKRAEVLGEEKSRVDVAKVYQSFRMGLGGFGLPGLHPDPKIFQRDNE